MTEYNCCYVTALDWHQHIGFSRDYGVNYVDVPCVKVVTVPCVKVVTVSCVKVVLCRSMCYLLPAVISVHVLRCYYSAGIRCVCVLLIFFCGQ